MLYFISANFLRPCTGGERYNKIVSDYIGRKHDVVLVDYPWRSGALKRLYFDFIFALKVLKITDDVAVVFDEALHQRMALSLLSSLVNPNVKFCILLHQLSFTRRKGVLYKKITGSLII